MVRKEDQPEYELPSLERLVTLATLLLGRLAVETGDQRRRKGGERRRKTSEEIE